MYVWRVFKVNECEKKNRNVTYASSILTSLDKVLLNRFLPLQAAPEVPDKHDG